MCTFVDRNARGHSSSSTEAGSALGPDWHVGLSLQGADQVRWCVCVNSMFEIIMSPDTSQTCCATSPNTDSGWFSAFKHGFWEVDHLRVYLRPSNLAFFSVMVQVSHSVLLEYQCEVEKIYTSQEQLCYLQQTVEPEKGRQIVLWTCFQNPSFFKKNPTLFKKKKEKKNTLWLLCRGAVAGLRPPHQWEDIRLWCRRQCHRRCAKHWALPLWQQGKQRTPSTVSPGHLNVHQTIVWLLR